MPVKAPGSVSSRSGASAVAKSPPHVLPLMWPLLHPHQVQKWLILCCDAFMLEMHQMLPQVLRPLFKRAGTKGKLNGRGQDTDAPPVIPAVWKTWLVDVAWKCFNVIGSLTHARH